MRRTILLPLIITTLLSLSAMPALAQVSLENWDYNRKPQLIDRLKETLKNIDDKIDQARDNQNSRMLNDLKHARYDLQSAVKDLRYVSEDNWQATVNYIETKLNDPYIYNYGIFDEGFWENQPTTQEAPATEAVPPSGDSL